MRLPRRRIPIASTRCRQRQRRAEAKRVIEALILGGLERTLNFGASCAKRQIPGCARLLAAQAAGLACREDPLVALGVTTVVRLMPTREAMRGSLRRIEAHRTAMPENVCAVPLCEELCPSLLESFNSPDSSGAERADPVQWQACLRRMARARLLRVLPSDMGSQRLAKDHRDRCVGDPGRQNEKERLIHRACCRMLRD